jgi:hypothetical protein
MPWVCATLVACVLIPAPTRADDLRERVEQLEKELRALKEELRRRDAAAAAAPPATPPAAQAPAAQAPAEKPAVAHAGKQPGYREVLDRVKLGAYGSFRYEGSSLEDQKHTFTFRRFVLTADANIAPRLHGMMELEFERFRELELEKSLEPSEGGLRAQQTVEGTNESEIAFEQAWLQYDIEDWLKLRGAVLVPLGRFNLNHDDNRWDLPRRSLIDRGIPVLPVPPPGTSSASGSSRRAGRTARAARYQLLRREQRDARQRVRADRADAPAEPGKQVIEIEPSRRPARSGVT